MELRYDKADDIFYYGQKELFWSSLYVLGRGKSLRKDLIREMHITGDEISTFNEELRDLKAMGLLSKASASTIAVTKRGVDVFEQVKGIVPAMEIRKRAIRDIDKVERSVDELMKMPAEKTLPLVRHKAKPSHPTSWAAFFLNVSMGFFVFLILMSLTYALLGQIDMGTLAIELILSPIVAVLVVGAATICLMAMYVVGQSINQGLFRR